MCYDIIKTLPEVNVRNVTLSESKRQIMYIP